MALYLISYDINDKDKDEYESLWAALRQLGAVKVLYSEWMLVGNTGQAKLIADQILAHLRTADRLLVQEVTTDAAWHNLMISDDAFRELLRYARS